jgi:hypothetical protein
MLPNAGFEIYGDPAYPQSAFLYGAFRNPGPGSPEAQFNTHKSQVRQCVEWGFKEVVAQFQFFHHKNRMKIYKQPIGKYCFYGNQTSRYFKIIPMDIDEYLDITKYFHLFHHQVVPPGTSTEYLYQVLQPLFPTQFQFYKPVDSAYYDMDNRPRPVPLRLARPIQVRPLPYVGINSD